MCSHREVVLLALICRYEPCGKVFYICVSCFCGQAYCRPCCRQENRAKQNRKSSALHQESEEGRLDHNQRQRELYRRQVDAEGAGREKNLTEQAAKAECSGVSMNLSDSSELRPIQAEPKESQEVHDDKEEDYPRCRICKRKGYWVDPFYEVGLKHAHPRIHRKNPAVVPRRTLENRNHS